METDGGGDLCTSKTTLLHKSYAAKTLHYRVATAVPSPGCKILLVLHVYSSQYKNISSTVSPVHKLSTCLFTQSFVKSFRETWFFKPRKWILDCPVTTKSVQFRKRNDSYARKTNQKVRFCSTTTLRCSLNWGHKTRLRSAECRDVIFSSPHDYAFAWFRVESFSSSNRCYPSWRNDFSSVLKFLYCLWEQILCPAPLLWSVEPPHISAISARSGFSWH